MTLRARHYSELHQVRTLAVSRGVCRIAVVIGAALTSALLLCAVFAETHYEQDFTTGPSLLAGTQPYFAFLDSRFDSYFKPRTYLTARPLPPDFEQATAALTPPAEPAPSTAPLAPNVMSPSAADSLAVQPLALAPRSLPRQTVQSTPLGASAQGNQELETSTSGNAFQRFFAKLFSELSSSRIRFASAAVDDRQLDAISITSRYDRWTAVYDISTHTVYMPDGSKLEAHSGFGTSLDDPTRVAEKDTGPTPPDIYDLQPREQPFHGIHALRLIPEDDQKTLGRTGLLAHSFMLGPNGQSNGCVSFRDYDAFLHAYLNHQVKRLVVVASLD
jgi:Tlde1 domain